MSKNIKNDYFVLEFKPNAQIYQEHILANRFRIGELIYNNALAFANERLTQMRNNKTYKNTLKQYLYFKYSQAKTANKTELKEIKQNIELYSE